MGVPSTIPTYELLEALRCARHDRRAEILEVLAALPEPAADRASAEHQWLWAEKMYRSSDYRRAGVGFRKFSVHPDTERTPTWMQVLARLRHAYAMFRLGDSEIARKQLDLANILLAADPRLRHFKPDAAALHAHLLEIEGGIELARACFMSAHHQALEGGRPGRAATTASDIGRLHADLGRIAEALEWQHAALAILASSPDQFIDRVVHARMARLEIAMRLNDSARARLVEVRARCKNDGLTPEAEISVLTALAELESISSNRKEARKRALQFLAEAQVVAEKFGLKPMQARIERELAHVHALMGSGDARRAEASAHFAKAVQIALDLKPIPGLKLQHLAEDLVRHQSALLPKSRGQAKNFLARVAGQLEAYRKAQRAGVQDYQHRRDRRAGASQELLGLVRDVIAPDTSKSVVRIDDFEFHISTLGLRVVRGGVTVDRRKPFVGRVLKCLVAAKEPVSALEIHRRALVSLTSAKSALSALRGHLGKSLVGTQGERPMRYSLQGQVPAGPAASKSALSDQVGRGSRARGRARSRSGR